MTPFKPMRAKQDQRGVAALAVALILLFGITLVAFFTNRSLIFEQRTSANQYRSTKALEMAEAGLEWAVARLNDDSKMQAAPSCSTSGTVTQRFGDRYLPLTNTGFSLTDNVQWPGCSISSGGTTTCGCPSTASQYPTYSSDTAEPRFRVSFTNLGNWAVRITSYGCTNAGAPCDTSGTPDGVAVVSSIYKMKPSVARAPGAGLLAGTATVTGGNLNVINTEPSSNGITIDTGSTVTIGSGTNVVSLPGTPPRSSVLDNDTSLSALTNADSTGDTFFKSFFGETMAEYQAEAETWLITSGSCGTNQRCTSCSSASNCGTAVSNAYNAGHSQFWSDTNVSWTTSNLPTLGTLGGSTSANPPIILATSANVELKSNITAFGLFYTATATATDNWDYSGSGTAQVFGAFITRGGFNKGSGTLDLIYKSDLFGEGTKRGTMVRVPGTWRDTSANYTTSN